MGKDGKEHSKAPKIQRLVTPVRLQRKRRRLAIKKAKITKVQSSSQNADISSEVRDSEKRGVS